MVSNTASNEVTKKQLSYLPSKMVLYIPDGKGVHSFLSNVTELLGGVTLINSKGTWLRLNKSIVYEDVIQYHMLYPTSKALALNELVQAEIQRLLDSGEEAVLLETSGAHGVLYSKLGD